jgi:CheY-like chemotaxis protein
MKILFIDDEPIRALTLIKDGHQVFIAHGQDQIEIMLTQKYDLICLDHDMPLMNGMDVVTKILPNFPNCRTVVHSTNAPAATGMVTALKELGVEATYIPYPTKDWKEKVIGWVNTVALNGK